MIHLMVGWGPVIFLQGQEKEPTRQNTFTNMGQERVGQAAEGESSLKDFVKVAVRQVGPYGSVNFYPGQRIFEYISFEES